MSPTSDNVEQEGMPSFMPNGWPTGDALREMKRAIRDYLSVDGSHGNYNAMDCHDVRERLLALTGGDMDGQERSARADRLRAARRSA